MTHEQKIQFIADRCAIANPRLKELEFGCEVVKNKKVYIIFECSSISRINATVYTLYCLPDREIKTADGDEIASYRILGRPIQLADVLMAIEKIYGEGDLRPLWEIQHNLLVFWNLSLGLYNQSPECIEFLYNLLK